MDDVELGRYSPVRLARGQQRPVVPSSGWQMPEQYAGGPREEHRRVRTAAGLFDLCTSAASSSTGATPRDSFQRMQTWDVSKLGTGQAHYAMLLRDDAGVLDDLFVFRLDPGWLLVVNASNRERDVAHLTAAAAGLDVRIRDLSDATGMIALQGPAARRILSRLAPGAVLPAYHRDEPDEDRGVRNDGVRHGIHGRTGVRADRAR